MVSLPLLELDGARSYCGGTAGAEESDAAAQARWVGGIGGRAGNRDDYVIASKFGNLSMSGGTRFSDGRPEYLRACCDRSLQRLKTEIIDLYYIHRVDPDVPIEDTVGAMGDLVRQGK